MRLQRIYSSKIYLTSSRKDRIHGAINNPVNAPLVKQLAEYLDEDAQAKLKLAKAELKNQGTSSTGTQPASEEANDMGGNDIGSAPSGGGFSPSPFTGDVMSDFGEDDLADVEPITDEPEPDNSEPADEVVESVTQEGKPITATSLLWTTVDDVSRECDTIKGTLNAREDTKGVNRLQVNEAELWIYYNDDSNLNDKMVEVISVLNSVGYTYLKFNRLARSNNAIVFDINLNSAEPVKTVKEIEEETK